MRRHASNQLVLDLDHGRRPSLPSPPPEGLLQALADLLLEALGKQNKAVQADRESDYAAENHA